MAFGDFPTVNCCCCGNGINIRNEIHVKGPIVGGPLGLEELVNVLTTMMRQHQGGSLKGI